MKIIDAHVHYSRIASFDDCALRIAKVDYSENGYLRETQQNNVVGSVCMGLSESIPARFPDADIKTPMIADLTDQLPRGMSICLGINPYTLSENSLAAMEEQIKYSSINIVGFKIYTGYYHFMMADPVYEPVYKIAQEYGLTVAFHTGDTYSTRGLLKYSHPLSVDELAVTHPDLKIVACHMGVPWVFDSCEVALKNPNVYLDISGMFVGDAKYIQEQAENPHIIERFKQALSYLNNYDKVLFGTDWPLAPMDAYIDFCKKIIPPEAYEKVFFQNAIKVYGLGGLFLNFE